MKKKMIYIPVLLSMLIILGSCKDFLTEDSLTQSEASGYFQSLTDVQAAIAGVYTSFQYNMRTNYHYWGEIRSDNFCSSVYPNTTTREAYVNGLTSGTGNVGNTWAYLYQTIGRANTCIKYIPRAGNYDINVTAAIRDKYLAECYAMRAICYFYIVRNWGDAPIWTEPYNDYTENSHRARVSQDIVMDTIVADLTKAYALIPKGATPTVWNIGEGAICAIMADVYMWKHDYANAIIWYKNLFNAYGPTGVKYALSGKPTASSLEGWLTWKNVFTNPAGSVEAIWNIYWDAVTYSMPINLPIGISGGNITTTTNNAAAMDTSLWNYYKTKLTGTVNGYYDPRGTITTDLTISGRDKVIKFLPSGTFSQVMQLSQNQYLPMYRMADIVLSYAEALTMSNFASNQSTAIEMVNLIRNRTGLTSGQQIGAFTTLAAADVPDQATLMSVILKERRYELAAEGKRWFDLRRQGYNFVISIMDPVIKARQAASSVGTTGFGSETKLLWPIRSTLIEDSENTITQNPDYY